MTAPPPRRPWWRRKRTWAALALWLALPMAYLSSSVPAFYCVGRGWLPGDQVQAAYLPAREFFLRAGLAERWSGWIVEAMARGLEDRHAASD